MGCFSVWRGVFETVYPLPLRYDFDLKAIGKAFPEGTKDWEPEDEHADSKGRFKFSDLAPAKPRVIDAAEAARTDWKGLTLQHLSTRLSVRNLTDAFMVRDRLPIAVVRIVDNVVL